MMLFRTALTRVAVAGRSSSPVQQQQRRSFIDWMTNYPDRIVELKKHHQAGGRAVYTWLKQPQDKYTTAFGAAFATVGLIQLCFGHYRLATGKGKLED